MTNTDHKGRNTEYKSDKYRPEKKQVLTLKGTQANIKITSPDHKADNSQPQKRQI